MLDKLLVLNGTVHLVHRDFERDEVGFIRVGLGEVSSRLVDSSDHPAWGFLQRNRLRCFSTLPPFLGKWLEELQIAFSI